MANAGSFGIIWDRARRFRYPASFVDALFCRGTAGFGLPFKGKHLAIGNHPQLPTFLQSNIYALKEVWHFTGSAVFCVVVVDLPASMEIPHEKKRISFLWMCIYEG